MITLLTGENDFEIRAALKRRIAEFRETHSEDAVTIADATSLGRDELPQLLLGANLFAPERLIVIDDASAQKIVWDKLADYLREVGDTTDVVLIAPSADKRTRTYKWLQKNATIQQFVSFQGPALEKWVAVEAKKKGMDMMPNVARFIIEYAGDDQRQLTHDLEKLALSGKQVTVELVRELLIPNPQASAFELLDAALNKQPARVGELLEGMRAGEDPYRFFGLLSNQIFAVMVVAAAGQRSPDQIAKDSGLHPYVIKKTVPLARRLSVGERTRLAEVAATTDMQLKSSGAEPWVLITAALKNIAA